MNDEDETNNSSAADAGPTFVSPARSVSSAPSLPASLLLASHRPKLAKIRSNYMEGESCPLKGTVISSAHYSCKLTQILYKQQRDGKFCDFGLKLPDGKVIQVHKSVLAATSNYFSCLFESGMMETQQGFVELNHIKEIALNEMIKFLYTGKLYVTQESVGDLVDAACHLQIESAVKLLSDYLITIITKNNCVTIYNLADRYCLQKVKDSSVKFIRWRFLQMSEDQLLLLTIDQMLSHIASDDLVCSTEWDLFNKVKAWLTSVRDETLLEEYINQLVKLIRFPLMTGEELVSKVSTVGFMKNNPSCTAILTEAKDYHIVPASQPFMQNNRTKVRHSNIIYMALCQGNDFYVYPLYSTSYKLLTEPIELKKPPRQLLKPAICVYNNFLYACGGIHDRSTPSISTARCFRYDPRFDSWFEIASMCEARQRFTCRVIGDYMYALGGCDESVVSESYECYSFAKDEWKKISFQGGIERAHRQASVAYKDSIYITGGHLGAYVSNSAVQCLQHPERPASLIIRRLPSMTKARKRHKMLAHNNKLFVMEGQSDTIEIFNILTQQWTAYKGFMDTLGHLSQVIGVCSLDPAKVIFVSQKPPASSSLNAEFRQPFCTMVNLEKDPETEKEQFVKKLTTIPKLSSCFTAYGTQIWMPAHDTLARMSDNQVMVDVINP